METIDNDTPRVDVVVYLGFDEESDKLLKLVWDVAQDILDKYGVWVEITPVNIWLMGYNVPELPRLEINGKTMIIGRVPSKEELIDMILSRVYKYERPDTQLYAVAASLRNNRIFENAALISI